MLNSKNKCLLTFYHQPHSKFTQISYTLKPISHTKFYNLTPRKHFRISNSLTEITEVTATLQKNPFFKTGYESFQGLTESLPENEKWGVLVFAGLVWVYLTARPGVLIGAIDTYVLANVQRVFDVMSGRRGLKSSDFLIGEKLGEGSFGVVYSGVVVPKGFSVEDRVRISGSKRRQLEKDDRFKEKVILKQVTKICCFYIKILV